MSDVGHLEQRINDAIEAIMGLGSFDGSHHKQYALDQALRVLTGCPTVELQSKYKNSRGEYYSYMGLGESDLYKQLCVDHMAGEDGPHTYSEWDEGIAP